MLNTNWLQDRTKGYCTVTLLENCELSRQKSTRTSQFRNSFYSIKLSKITTCYAQKLPHSRFRLQSPHDTFPGLSATRNPGLPQVTTSPFH
jgi:hypothetical protein